MPAKGIDCDPVDTFVASLISPTVGPAAETSGIETPGFSMMAISGWSPVAADPFCRVSVAGPSTWVAPVDSPPSKSFPTADAGGERADGPLPARPTTPYGGARLHIRRSVRRSSAF